MFIVGLLGWWYTVGWKQLASTLTQKLIASEDFFSFDLLLSSLFAPFKQISAVSSREGTLQMKLQAWFDKQFSRVFGAVIRTLIMFVGILWLFVQFVLYLAVFLFWPLLPVLPVLGLVLMVMGVRI